MSTQFVEMYHPNIPATAVTPALVAVQAVDEQYARGWLLFDPTAPPPVVNTPYYTREASDSRYVRDWVGAETVTAGAIRMAPDGHVIVRAANGTTRSSYDVSEQGLWNIVGGSAAVDLANTVSSSGTTQILADLPVTFHDLTLTAASCALTFPAPATAKSVALLLRQDATGSRAVTWPASVKWPGGIAPTLSTTPGTVDEFVFTSYSGTAWRGKIAALGYTS